MHLRIQLATLSGMAEKSGMACTSGPSLLQKRSNHQFSSTDKWASKHSPHSRWFAC